MNSRADRLRALAALTARLIGILAVIFLAAGCAGTYTQRAPIADSSAGGVRVRFSGTLFAFGYGVPPIAITRNIYMCEPWLWTVVINVKEAMPQVYPIVSGGKAKIILESPLRFFGTNDLVIDGAVQKSIIVWRGKDGFLHAVSAPEPSASPAGKK